MSLALPSVEGYILGFDFGTKRIGVAVGQTITRTATPLTTLAATQGVPDWRLVKQLVDTWQPKALVVGIPLNMDGTEQKVTKLARTFANALKRETKLPVFGTDERLTTVAARADIFETQGYRGLQQSQVDAHAAALLLTEWLQQH
jgi:putative Holliday junction resolvase